MDEQKCKGTRYGDRDVNKSPACLADFITTALVTPTIQSSSSLVTWRVV